MADENQDRLYAMRHSLAHIMATAITTLWPEVKLGVGPVVENGFYYDIDIPNVTISTDDFPKIEAEMKKIIQEDQTFELSEKQIDEAITWAEAGNQPYKVELLNDLKREGTTRASELTESMMGILPAGISGVAQPQARVGSVTFYTNGTFTDLCRGPHVESTGKVGAFKLMRVAGAYWRGNEKNPQMQRLYGVAFETQDELDSHLNMLEEAKKRDHRKLGKELDLFVFSDLVGPGLPLFTPRGTILRDKLNQFSESLQSQGGYGAVTIPHITKTELYKTSGHYDKYPERFSVSSEESDDEFMMKPMNCPHHTQIYASQPRSYKDLPIRYRETTMVYRDEKAGELHGLSRVRAATQDDSHAFCLPSQIEDEFESIARMVESMYRDVFKMDFRVRLAFRDDSDKYFGEEKLWETAQEAIQKIADKLQFEYVIEEGEATFYGPKIEFVVTDAIGRENQCATIQLDFVQPERFKLEYTAEDGSKQTPVMIHKALLGSTERFLSVYIEHTAGWFPFWLAPEQVRTLTINDTVNEYVDQIKSELDQVVLMKPVKYNEVRYTVDDRNESLGKKIKEATEMKIPVQLIVGPKDRDAGEVSVRTQEGEQKVKLAELKDFILGLSS